MKYCKSCKSEKELSEFRKYDRTSIFYSGQCKSCLSVDKHLWVAKNFHKNNERNKAYNRANARKIRGNKLTKYWPGSTWQQALEYYQALHTKQQGVCAICQPYGDDQRRGLWLYHVLEPSTWYKVVARVNGVNSGALYIQESGNITGYAKISKPAGHTWKSFANLLLSSLPKSTSDHYISKFRVFIKWWKARGYPDGIPDESPAVLENKRVAPSWRRICKVLLRNDYWCKGLAFTQPKSEAYGRYLEMKKNNTLLKAPREALEEDLK